MKIKCTTCEKVIAEVRIGRYDVQPVLDENSHVSRYEQIFVEDENGSSVIYDKESGIFAMRKRTDGTWGVECSCGADSRIASNESDHIFANGVTPNPHQITQIKKAIAENPTEVHKKKVGKHFHPSVDGFIFIGA